MPNGIWNGATWFSSDGDGYRYILSQVPRLNALESEGTFTDYSGKWYSEIDWQKSVELISWVQDNFLSNNSERYFSAACIASVLPSNTSIESVMTYGYCSTMLAAKMLHREIQLLCFGLLRQSECLPASLLKDLELWNSNEPLGKLLQGQTQQAYIAETL